MHFLSTYFFTVIMDVLYLQLLTIIYVFILYVCDYFMGVKKKNKKQKVPPNTCMSAYASVYLCIYIVILSRFSYAICNHILVLWNSLNLVLRPMHYVFCWRLDALVRLNHQSPAGFSWVSKTQKVIESNLQRLSHW